MILLLMFFAVIASFYSGSFARYNWNKNNKKAVIGIILLTAASFIIPLLVYLKNG